MNKEEIDRFQQIAGGGKKKLDCEIKRMDELPPKHIERQRIESGEKEDVFIPSFDEKSAYKSFIEEKVKATEHYKPFFKDFSSAACSPEKITELKEFFYRKETEADKLDFAGVLAGNGEWEKIILPKYEGPTGKWNAFYRRILTVSGKEAGKRYLIDFEAIDYIAEVYLNGRLIDRHEGFFSPFTVDLTENIKEGENVLLVVVKNDITTSGITVNGVTHYGNKIYAETHLGYDEPYLGWHHCPAGAGIFGKVEFVVANEKRITDIFVLTDTDNAKITVNATVTAFDFNGDKAIVELTVEGKNFRSEAVCETVETKPFSNGENYISKVIELKNFVPWTTENPYLYSIKVTVKSSGGVVYDEKKEHFGMRKFVSDENSSPKGAFYLNGERIILRGTNEMGHLPRAVMDGDDERLLDDIMIAKVAGLNFFRMTQRPVFKKIYDFFDMTGMLCQSDFPLFSYLKYSALGEAAKQIDEMEKLTRNHPSVIVESLCNETLDRTAWGTEQYNMSRMEIERFFNAAKEIILLDNPTRVIKYNEGDYAPIENTYGISDFHCYTFWYVSHGMPSGKLDKGYLPPIRKDWFTGCGEYGVDGLDRFELMKKYCPKEWLPQSETEPWSPRPVAREQCYVLHGDFFPEQDCARDWIKASRDWQKKAIKEYVHILRRRTDMIESTALHLLIDAWPCGWTKTLVDVERIPKPAYYAFKEANVLTRADVRSDRRTVYAGDEVVSEIYMFNDRPEKVGYTLTASVYLGEELVLTYKKSGDCDEVIQTYVGEIATKIPDGYCGKIAVKVQSETKYGVTFDEMIYFSKPKVEKVDLLPEICGERVKDVAKICGNDKTDKIIVCDGDYFTVNQREIENRVKNGAKAIVFIDKSLNVIGDDVIFPVHTIAEEVRANNFVARSRTSKYTEEFGEEDFKDFYNAEKDYRDLTAWFKFDWKDSEEILYTFEDSDDPEYALHKKHKLICAEKKYGKGSVVLSTLSALNGCIGYNPTLDKFLINLIEK